MVDFNNETTIGTPASDVEKISILQRRYDLIEAFEDYKKKRFNGIDISTCIIRARLISLFIEIQACLKRRLKDKEYQEIYDLCFKEKSEEKILIALLLINEELDKINLTKIDNQRVYDSTDVEAENDIKGF